ncbi:MAG: copper amine oxidase domain protein, partial [Clostridia bacterium]|nr:copper amine oxidase domain protein [Clostridia bacterium]
MKSKKALAVLLTASVLSLNTVSAFAADTNNVIPINDGSQITEVNPIKAELPSLEEFKFGFFTGKVKEIRDREGVEGSKFVLVESSEGTEANIIISKDTYVLSNAEIAEGAVITGYFNANAPMIMIYPAQYNAEVVVVDKENQNVKVDIFDENLVSSDNFLKLNISDATEIVLPDGTAYEGELANKKLVVLYGISTRSIPAQTTPDKVVVLLDKETVPTVQIQGDVSAMDIVVNNKKIEAPAAYSSEEGVVMIPLRAVAEALGYEVTWNDEQRSVYLGKAISLTIGSDSYNYMKTAPIELEAAPTIVEGRTFVPLSFFKTVLRMNNAYVLESQ